MIVAATALVLLGAALLGVAVAVDSLALLYASSVVSVLAIVVVSVAAWRGRRLGPHVR